MQKKARHAEESPAARVARQLAARFLEAGNYLLAGPMARSALEQVMPAAVAPGAIDRYFEDAGFAGLAVQAVGYEKGGDESKVHVYLLKGPRKAEMPVEGLEQGVTIEVNRIGKVIVRPEAASASTARGQVFVRNNRVACGSSCAPSGENLAGTLGTLVRKQNDSSLFVLSNNHVFANCNHVAVGMPILSPSPMDAGPNLRAPSEICRHSEICELRSGVPTLVPPCREDVAIARVANPGSVTSWQGEGPESYDTPATAIEPRAGLRVKKFGRTTGLTRGTVESVTVGPTAIPYNGKFFQARVYFDEGLWTVRADAGLGFALPGDSGSLVVTEDGAGAVGLVFAQANQGQYAYIISMTHILELFGGLRLVRNHGV